MIHFQTPLYHIFYLFKPWYNQLANNIHLYPHPPYPSCSCYMYQKIEKKNIYQKETSHIMANYKMCKISHLTLDCLLINQLWINCFLFTTNQNESIAYIDIYFSCSKFIMNDDSMIL